MYFFVEDAAGIARKLGIPQLIIGLTIVLAIFGITDSSINFAEGIIFWILFILYLVYLFIMAKKTTVSRFFNH